MAKIDQQLLARLCDKLSVKPSRVYSRIQRIANAKALDRDLAALVLASEVGISINKYSTPQQRVQIRGATPADQPNITPIAALQNATRAARRPKGISKRQGKKVFVVHGRNESLRRDIFAFLRSIGLQPLEWSTAVAMAKGGNPFVGDILDAAMAKAAAVLVLFSGDDQAKLRAELVGADERSTEGKLTAQPRPNVIFEAGLALGRHQEKTLLVQVGRLRPISDLAGRHLVHLNNSTERRQEVARRLERLGCRIDISGTDWHSAGNFVE